MIRALVLLLAMATAVQAQSRAQAAANNIHLAMGLCLQNYHDPQELLDRFIQAGFAYSPEDFGGGDILHWFADPSGTMRTAVVVDGASVECRIGTDEWGVAAMLPFAQDTFAKLAPNVAVNTGSPEGQNILPGTPAAQNGPCSGFNVFLPRSLLWVQIERQGNDGTCTSDGTSVLTMKF